MKKLISVVIPAYNEEAVVDELCKQLKIVFGENREYEFEAIIVENGSTDRTFGKLLQIHLRPTHDQAFTIGVYIDWCTAQT